MGEGWGEGEETVKSIVYAISTGFVTFIQQHWGQREGRPRRSLPIRFMVLMRRSCEFQPQPAGDAKVNELGNRGAAERDRAFGLLLDAHLC
jgi:hypothetical protein